MDPNPYQSPKIPTTLDSERQQLASIVAHDLLREWEYRRLWFNAILVGEILTLSVLSQPLIFQVEFWAYAIQRAISANVCFCVGPVVNWYLSRPGLNHRVTGILLFWLGTALAVLLTLVSTLKRFSWPE